VVGDGVALTGRVITVDLDGALPVELRRRVVPMQVGGDGRQSLATIDDVAGFGPGGVPEPIVVFDAVPRIAPGWFVCI